MTQEGFKRKLTAILSADVEGYSRLMDQDEEATIRTLTAYRWVITDMVQQYRGRVVDTPGDNILAEFTSVIDAVNCSVEIQRNLALRNAELPPENKMEFRIGVNVGDVVEEEDRIYGDGVNIAARVEAMAEAGGICITGRAYDQVKNKLELGYKYLGEHSVKNITEPVRVYKVLMEPDAAGKVIGEKKFLGKISRRSAIAAIIILIVVAGGLAGWNFYLRQSKRVEPASLDKMAFPLPDKPSIAVLAFDNMSGDQKQEYIADGITENIITTLSKVHDLFVISRNSSFTYKGKPVKVKQVSEELGVKYVLEGSVQRSGDRVRVIAQLIDAIDGKHLWSERYDRDFKDIFELQDELASKVVNSLMVKLVWGEEAKLWQKNRPSNLQFNEKYFEARFYLSEFNKEANIKAKQLFEELINLEPEFFHGYAGVAFAHYMDVHLKLSSSPRESLRKAVKLCEKAITLDESQDMPHRILGQIYAMSRKFDKAIVEGELAITLNPNSALAYIMLGRTLMYAGRTEEALDLLKKSARLNPLIRCKMTLGAAYREAGQYEEAINEFKRCINYFPNNIIAHSQLSSAYASVGRYEEAREAWSEVLKIDPKMTAEKFFPKRWPYGPEHRKRAIATFHKAGIK
jgi:adenylate cyclase